MKQAKLVHIAVRSAEPRSLADFYKSAFGLKEVLSNRRADRLPIGAFMTRKVIRSIFHRGVTTRSRRNGCKSNLTIKL